MRVIIFTGKGGSGVTTLAAATATAIAKRGSRTLLFAFGPGLGEAFGVHMTPEPHQLAERLEAMEGHSGDSAADEFRDWLEDLLDWRGVDVELAEDLAALPGLSHVGRLLELERCANGSYDAIVVDAAPISQFLELPGALDAAARWLERLFAPRQQNVFEPFLRVFAGEYASTGEEVFERGRELLTRLANLRDVLTDPEASTVRLVLPATQGADATAREAVAALSLYSFATDALVLNRLLPAEVSDPFFAPLQAEQKQAAEEMTGGLAPLPVLQGFTSAAEVRGLEPLGALAAALYGERDPADVLHASPGHTFSEDGDSYILSVWLPFARKEDLRLEQSRDGVAIHLNGRRCLLSLPEEVRFREASSWSFEGQELTVTFNR
jgi:arsenite-transporting ATPase